MMRRRLTVTGASDTIDGVARMSVEEKDKALQYERAKAERCAVSEYSGVSKKGHAPYNPRKKNQDAMIMAEDPTTNTLVLCVLDGHGEHGDGVSYHVRDCLPTELFNHPAWATDVKQASRDAILAVEDQIARNFRIDTEFSGTTLSMAIIRGNTITGVNIGDSRVLIASEDLDAAGTGATGAATISTSFLANPLTIDHKPDSPGEQERIIAAGGRVFAVEYDDGVDGPARVWLGHMDVPGLAMSR
jgi:serine/threonine protein phosphatase PrpC